MSDLPKIFKAGIYKSRKEYKCCECRKIILKGSEYYSAYGLWDKKFETFRRCISCYELAEEVHSLECKDNLYPEEFTAFGDLFESAKNYELI